MTKNTSSGAKVGSVFDLLGKSYRIVKENWQLFAIVNIFTVLYAVMDALNPGDYDTAKENSNLMFTGPPDLSGFQLSTIVGGGLLILLLFMAVNFFFLVMSLSLEVKSTGGKKPDFSELFNDGKKFFFPMLGLIIILAIIIGIGFLLLIVPGVIAVGRLAMAPYIMIDRKVGIEESMKQSNELGKKYFGKVWAAISLIILVAIVTGIIGAIPILGPLAAAAITIAYSVILALRYRELRGQKI